VALKISSEDTCSGAASDHSYRGPVDSRPVAPTTSGNWVIGGQTFVVTTTTTFSSYFTYAFTSTLSVLPAVGDCVSVTYSTDATTSANIVKTVAPANCVGDTPGNGIFEADGAVIKIITGTWTIGDLSNGGVNYIVDGATKFNEQHGKLGVGACVQVHYHKDLYSSARVANEIATESGFRCTRTADDHDLYGQIKQLPGTTGQLGSWSIGNIVVVVTTNTTLTGGPFAVGQLVAVKFQRAGDGSLVAISIKVKQSEQDEKSRQGAGKAHGFINTLPTSGTVGLWVIGSTPYTVTITTRIDKTYKPKVGDCVEVYFQADTAGARTALKISSETTDNTCTNNLRVYGTVTSMPATGYLGNWIVAGTVYSATATTVFTETNGPLAVGAFVQVTYVKSPTDGTLLATQIRTIVPPGAGDTNHTGKVGTFTPAPKSLAVTAAAATPVTWTIGGTTYQVTADTLLNDSLTTIQSGTTVTVNAYTNTSGQLVATQVTAVSVTFLPLVER
jgi:hypothetical protein